ncbi:MAG: VWA domain-containing protein, partial [Chloroflexota bacterium]
SKIQLSLHDQEGLPLQPGSYDVRVTAVNTGEQIPPDRVSVEPLELRPPLQMLLLLDITNTVPLDPVVDAVANTFIPQLQVEDRVSLITFAENTNPRTQFYTDKNRLLNEFVLELTVQPGENRIYDTLYQAVTEFPIGVEERQVIFLLTDSGRRFDDQRPISDIVDRATREDVQIYIIGFNSGADVPDVTDYSDIATRTGGHMYLWDNVIINRENIRAGLADILNESIVTLNSEAVVSVNLEGQRPDEDGFITFRIEIETNNEELVTDRVICPIEALTHSITFRDDVEDGTIIGPVDVVVEFESDLGADEVVPVFTVNGQVVQDNEDPVLMFNQPPLQPGFYTIGARLLSRDGVELASTERELNLYVQSTVELDALGAAATSGDITTLGADAQFEVRSDFDLPPVQFFIAESANPDDQKRLGDPVPFNDGLALLVLPSIRETVETLFPETEEELFTVTAFVTGVQPSDPSQAVSNEFQVLIPQRPVATVDAPRFRLNFRYVPWLLALMFLLMNMLLFRAIARSRVRRIIAREDDYEMPAQLMMLTVRREGVKQTYNLTKKTFHLGRGSSNDVNLGDDPNISRNHGVIMYRRGEWFFSNRKRRAISRVNGKMRIGYVWERLVPITEIQIGNSLVVFHSSAQQDVSELVKTNF